MGDGSRPPTMTGRVRRFSLLCHCINPVFQTFRKQRGLRAIGALNEAPHLIPPQIAEDHSARISSGRAFHTWGNSGIEPYSGSENTTVSPSAAVTMTITPPRIE